MYRFIIPVLALIIAVNVSMAMPKKKKELTENEKIEFKNAFYEGNKQKMLGNLSEAALYFSKCIQIDNNSAASYYELANVYMVQGNYMGALMHSEKAASLDQTNIWYHLQLASLYKQNSLPEKAADIYKQIIKYHPDDVQLYLELGMLLTKQEKHKEAIKTYDIAEKKGGINEAVSLEKERIYLLQGEKEKAQNEIIKLINANPGEPKYHGYLAESYMENNQFDKALESYNKILEIDPGHGLAHLSLAEFYNKTGKFDKSFEHLKKAFSSDMMDIDTKVKMLSGFIPYAQENQDVKTQSAALIEILLNTHPNEVKAHNINADYLSIIGKLKEARTEYQYVLSQVTDKYIIWEQLLLINNELEDFESMYVESQKALELFPGQPELYLFNGLAATKSGKNEQALITLNKGIDLVVENDLMVVQFYSFMGEAYKNLKQFEKSDSIYLQALDDFPTDRFILNSYSLSLAERKVNLDKATVMIKKALEGEPENPVYLDTYAWVLFNLKSYKEAKEIIEKAINFGGGNSAVIIEHYGDILFMNGLNDEALIQWKKAREMGKGTELLDRKIEQGKLIEKM
ncbi:MAG: hypothetical protein A2W91_06950 [Bacteroidetes bacterium GWF2_38_335]|nr:MAG: hypothetical protein A2W91_06950 [Bacteroidetes bacterium GWF2_38_335]OFY80887.1 MAG: hypothetical protein A2281_04755 [Bacteroidetes bacterium RIFOXYA12_FULL_38_20]HBS84955.1 hypothetical protein [Bacteroidales bacterium]